MTLSGPDNTWLNGSWDNLKHPVMAWVVWLANDVTMNSRSHEWKNIPDRILAVCVFHDKERKTLMCGVDGYPNPGGSGDIKFGEQIGPDDSEQWNEKYQRILIEATEWQQHII